MLLYWSVFRYGFSTQVSDWGNFGNFFSGLLNPILTAINILVFVKLTTAVSKLDDERADRDYKCQQALLLMQFQKKEIDNFEKIINNAFVFHPSRIGFITNSLHTLAEHIVEAELYLNNFVQSKLSLFNLTPTCETATDIERLIKEIIKYHNNFVSGNNISDDDVSHILKLTSSIIVKLQNITLNK